MLRLVCCALAVDSVALMDATLPVGGKYVCDGAETAEEARRAAVRSRQDRVLRAGRCMGCACEECPTCADVNARLNRDRDWETALWGPQDEPKKTVKWLSYRTEEDEDGNSKASNELQQHEDHPSKFLDELIVSLEKYKSHYYTLKRQKRAHREQERNFQIDQMLFDMDFAENFTIILAFEIQSAHWISKQVTILSRSPNTSTWTVGPRRRAPTRRTTRSRWYLPTAVKDFGRASSTRVRLAAPSKCAFATPRAERRRGRGPIFATERSSPSPTST